MKLSLKDALKESGLVTSREGSLIHCKGRLADMQEFLSKRDRLAWKHGSNRLCFDSHIDAPSEIGFLSMPDMMRGLQGDMDMTAFIEAKDRLQASGLMDSVSAQLEECRPKRKRKFSEYDGEFDRERRWDLEPFMDTYKAKVPVQVVTIETHFGASAGHIESTNKLGALSWALAELLEAAGFMTRIVYVKKNTQIRAGMSGLMQTRFELTAKEPSEYVNPVTVAAMFSAAFYRRAIWGGIAAVIDAEGLAKPSMHVGCPYVPHNGIVGTEGKISIACEIFGDFTELERAIMAAIKPADAAAA